ncbi:MAG: V-type ATP synthase subunit D [Candidatus Altiarchaeota archaeon]
MTDDTVDGVHPTRMELLVIKKKKNLAEKGHKLLKEKRDALAMEFMDYVKKAEGVASQTTGTLSDARKKLTVAYATAGAAEVASSAIAAQTDITFNLGHKNVMGVPVPELSLEDTHRRADERGFGLTFTAPSIDEAADGYEEALARLVEFAGVEKALSVLSEETLKTRRRVNALERKVIPELTNTEKYIRLRLEEINRENFFRLKVMKKKKARK